MSAQVGPIFLFVPTDGGDREPYYSQREPTASDCEFVETGQVAIIRLSDLHYLSSDGTWFPVAQAILATPDLPGERDRPFHIRPTA